VFHQYPAHTSTPRTSSATQHFNYQIHDHKRSDWLKQISNLVNRHFCFELACSYIVAWLSALATAASRHKSTDIAALIFTYNSPSRLSRLLLSYHISGNLCSKHTSMAYA
jgi:hypothetical protein